MKELHELAGIIAKHRLKKIEILNNSSTKPGKAGKQNRDNKTYHAIKDKKLANDEEAAAFMGFKGVDNAYHTFIHRFTQKLLNGLFFLEVKLSDHAHAEYQCSRLRHIVNILFLFGGRNTAIEYVEKMLGIAQKFDLAESKVFCYKALREHASYTGDGFWYPKYNSLYSESFDQMILEYKAEDFLNRINVMYARTIAQLPETANQAFKYVHEIEEDIKKHDTPVLQYYHHKLRGLGYQIEGKYERSNEIWATWESYLKGHLLFASDKLFGEAALYRMDNYVYLFQHNKAKKCADTCLNYFREDSRNRLIFLENYFLLAMRSGDYINARVIFNLATINKRLHTLPTTNQEKWKIFEVYLFYVEKGDEKSKIAGNKLDLNGFVKDIHVYKNDKEGFYISMLIVQICALIRTEKDVKPIEKLDALKLYKKRYLKTDISYRVNVFMDLLFALDKVNYIPSAMKKEEALLLKKLAGVPIGHTNNIEGIEVILFEQLWEMVTADIDKA